MSNVTIFILFAFINFGLISFVFRFWGKTGILCYIIMSVIAANLQVNKGIIFNLGFINLEATLGNVMFAGIFLATDLLNEKYGHRVAKEAVTLSIVANLSFILIMFISTLYHGLDYSEPYNNALDLFFSIRGGALKAVLISNLIYFISQRFDVFIYDKIKTWNSDEKTLWIRNNGSTFLSQLLDTLLVSIGFALVGIFPFHLVGSMIITTLIIKYIAALVDTPFLYIMNRITPKEDHNNL